MEEERLEVIVPKSGDPVAVALSRVQPFLSANWGRAASAGEFWKYLCDRDGFYCREPNGKPAAAGPEAEERGFRFARIVLNHAVGKGVASKVPNDDLWVLKG
jgi:hypothetical protein